jgi:hypothetical protein
LYRPTTSSICFTAYSLQRYVGDLEPMRGEALAVTPAWMMTAGYDPISLLRPEKPGLSDRFDRSQLRDPARLSRLLSASCLAYLWIVYLGVCAVRDNRVNRLHRRDHCDLNLFRLGFRLLARYLKEHLPTPNGFLVPAILPVQPRRRWRDLAT